MNSTPNAQPNRNMNTTTKLNVNNQQTQQQKQKQAQKNQQQFFMRDDIIQFSYDVVKSSRNTFRKRSKSFLKNNINMSTQLPKTNTNTNLTNNSKGKIKQEQMISFNLNQIIGSNQVSKQKQRQINRRTSFTSRNTHRYNEGNSFRVSKTQSMFMQVKGQNKIGPLLSDNCGESQKGDITQQRVSSIPKPNRQSQQNLQLQSKKPFKKSIQQKQSQNSHNSHSQTSYHNLQKKHNKSRLNDISIQSWLNQALIQASPNIYIDKNIQFSGLKIYNIDRSSLLRKGIHSQHVSRLYRSFFVYSIGFNNLLRDLCNRNSELRKAIWKVFAVLLEYCSGGKFQTMIGEIQRDKQAKLIQLKGQIQKRQRQLVENDEKNEKKNMKILKQVRQLQQKTKVLKQQKDMVQNDFHEVEQAFNEQISLRLKYETKINEIYGVYEQLRQKNSLLKQEHAKNLTILQRQQKTISALKSQLSQKSAQIQKNTIHITQLQSQHKFITQNLTQLQSSSKKNGINYLTAKHQSQNYCHIIAQKNRRVQQLQLTIKNMQSTQNSLMLTIKSKTNQFERAMKQNAELHDHIIRNTKQINLLMEEKREISCRQTEITSLLAIQEKRVIEKDQQLKLLKEQISHVREQLRLKEIDFQAELKKNQTLTADLSNCYDNIKKMKEKQNQLTAMLQDAQMKIQLLKQTLQIKRKQQQKYIKQIETLKTSINELKIIIKQKQSAIQVLQNKLQHQKQAWQSKYSLLQTEKHQISCKYQKIKEQKQIMEKQLQIYRQKYQKTYIDLKNEKFQRNNLDLYYKQSLAMMEEQIEHIKRLNIQISEMSQTLQQSKRKYKALEMIHIHKTQILEKDLAFWKKSYEVQQKKSKQKKFFIHPMVYEDLRQAYIVLCQKMNNLNSSLKSKEKRISEILKQKNKLVQQSKNVQKKNSEGIQKHYKDQIQKKDAQLTFLRQKTQYQSLKMKDAQQFNQKIKNQKDQILQTQRRSQIQLMNRINQKSSQLSQINQKYRSILNLNQQEVIQNKKLSQKWELQKKQLKAKIQQLTHMLKHQRIQKKNHKIVDKKTVKIQISHTKDNQNEKYQDTFQKIKKQNSQQVSQAEEVQNLLSKQEQINQSQNININNDQDEKPQQLAQDRHENYLKKRQDIKKKIRGAYLYYRK